MAALPPQPVDVNGHPFTRGTSEQELDQWNRALRSSDLYQNFLKQQGLVDSGRGVTMSRDQQAALEATLKQNGIQIPTKDFQIDQGGNLNQGNRLVRNLAIGAGVAAGGYLAAPYIAGALGAGGGAGAAGTVTGEGLGTGALLAGEGGAAGMGLGGAGLGLGAAGSGVLTGAGGAASTLGTVANIAGKAGSTYGKVSDLLSGAGSAVGAATNAAAGNRATDAQLGLAANGQNIQGQSAFENELMARTKEEDSQRSQALKDVYRQSYATNRVAGLNNTQGLTKYSPEYLKALEDLKNQGTAKLSRASATDTGSMTPLSPYKPYVPSAQPSGSPSTYEQVGNWLGPGLKIASMIPWGSL